MLNLGLAGQDLIPEVGGVLPIVCLHPVRELEEVNLHLLQEFGPIPLIKAFLKVNLTGRASHTLELKCPGGLLWWCELSPLNPSAFPCQTAEM